VIRQLAEPVVILRFIAGTWQNEHHLRNFWMKSRYREENARRLPPFYGTQEAIWSQSDPTRWITDSVTTAVLQPRYFKYREDQAILGNCKSSKTSRVYREVFYGA
jgi:hypothetical protein